jgi:hypothetical protein
MIATNDDFGYSVSLSDNGNIVATGAPRGAPYNNTDTGWVQINRSFIL